MSARSNRINMDLKVMSNHRDYKVTLIDNCIDKWLIEFDGPSDTYYEGLHFRLKYVFTVRMHFPINL